MSDSPSRLRCPFRSGKFPEKFFCAGPECALYAEFANSCSLRVAALIPANLVNIFQVLQSLSDLGEAFMDPEHCRECLHPNTEEDLCAAAEDPGIQYPTFYGKIEAHGRGSCYKRLNIPKFVCEMMGLVDETRVSIEATEESFIVTPLKNC